MNTCVCCGAPVPEGRQVYPICEGSTVPDAILKDGTRLYLKTTSSKGEYPLQMELYDMLTGYKRAVSKED